jgi:hypothetical protein
MKPISTRMHSLLDYTVAALLIASPWLFGFASDSHAQWIPVILGAATVLASLLTRYEGGLIKLIPMPVHLAFDALSAVFLIASPWLFGFAQTVYIPHVVIGLMEITVVLLTSSKPAKLNRG